MCLIRLFSCAFAGIKASGVVKEAKAATETTVYVAVDEASKKASLEIADFRMYLNVNYKGDGDDWSPAPGLLMTKMSETYDSKQVYSVSFTDKYNGLGAIQFQIRDGETWKEQDQVFGGQQWTSASVYNGKIHVYGGTGWADYAPVVTHEYKYSVNGGAAVLMNDNPDNVDERMVTFSAAKGDTLSFTKDGDPFAVTANELVNNNVDEDLKIKNAGEVTLYLNVSSKVLWATGFAPTTSYIYYISAAEDADHATTDRIYAWGGANQFGDHPGKSIVGEGGAGATELSTVLHFNGTAGRIYKIPVTNADDCFQFVNQDGTVSSSNKEQFAFRAAYHWSDATGDADAGLALDLLDRVETARNAASFQEHNYSVCGIAAETAAQLWNDYYDLGKDHPDAKAYVDASETKTYVGKGNDGNYDWTETYISFDQIMLQLRKIASDGGQTVSGGNEITISNGRTVNYAPIVIIVSSIAIVSLLGAGLMIKRRKEDR